MINLTESIIYLIDDCFKALADDALRRAWEIRICFALAYTLSMCFGYSLNSHNYRGFLGFTIANYGTFIITRIIFDALECMGEPFEEKPFYKFLF